MKKNNTNLILISSTILLLIFVGIFVYLLNVIKNKNKHTSVVVSTLEMKMAEKKNINILEKKMSELGDMHKKIDGYILDSANIDVFVEYLENIGTNNKVELSVKGVELPKNEKNKVLVNLSMNGSFPNVIRVVNLLENAPYNITINSLYLNKELVQDVETINPKDKTKEAPIVKQPSWQADVNFSILSS